MDIIEAYGSSTLKDAQAGVKEAKILLADAQAKLTRLEKLYETHMKRT